MAESVSADSKRCERIVSLAPSITESLFELGMGGNLVGVTRFCRYPAPALEIPKVGGYLDLSAEAILKLKPTDLFSLAEHTAALEPLRRLGVRIHQLDHSTISGIKSGYRVIGDACGVEQTAQRKLDDLKAREAAVARRCIRQAPLAPSRIIAVVGRAYEGSVSSGLYISGRDGFYTDLIGLIGGVNAHSGLTIALPNISVEGLIKLDPEVIFEVINADDPIKAKEALATWDKYPAISAVKNKRVFVLADDFASIPGPRFVLLAEQMADLVC